VNGETTPSSGETSDNAKKDDNKKPSLPLYTLYVAAAQAATPKAADNESGAHDAFRYEWGRWTDDGNMAELMDQMNKVKIRFGGKVYDRLLAIEKIQHGGNSASGQQQNFIDSNNIQDVVFTKDKEARRFRVSGGDNWDCILHVLPKGTEWQGRWPAGSWAVVRTLTGLAEIAMLRGPDRDGFIKKVTTVKMRGGGDGTLGSGSEGGGGEDAVKYVGGAMRSYAGVSGKTMLLEVVLRPPIGDAGKDGDGNLSSNIEPLPPEDVLMKGIEEAEEVPIEEEKQKKPPRELPREKIPIEPTLMKETASRKDRQFADVQEPTIPLSEFPARNLDFLEDTNDDQYLDEEEVYDDDGYYDEEYYDDEYQDEVFAEEYEDEYEDGEVYADDFYDENVEVVSTGGARKVVNELKSAEASVEDEENDGEEGEVQKSLGEKMGLSFDKVGGLDEQLDAIVRRVLASR
jgi:hypothetical protein